MIRFRPKVATEEKSHAKTQREDKMNHEWTRINAKSDPEIKRSLVKPRSGEISIAARA
jgi:hypothetical protein